MQVRTQGLAMAASAYLCWGLLSPGNAVILEEVGPLWLQAQRGVLALGLLCLVMPRRVMPALHMLRAVPLYVTLWFGTVASFLLFTLSQTRIAPAHTTLAFMSAPFWTALIAWLLLRERPNRWFLPAAAVMAAGAALVVGARGSPADGLGLTLGIASGATWGVYTVRLRGHGDLPWKDLLMASMFVAAPMFILLALLWEPAPDLGAVSARTWRWTVIQVLVPTIAGIALFQSSLPRIRASTANLFVGLELVGAVVWSWLLLGHRTSGASLVGVAIVIAAVTAYLGVQDRGRIPGGAGEGAESTRGGNGGPDDDGQGAGDEGAGDGRK